MPPNAADHRRPITATERDLIKYSAPAFGEYADLVARIRSLLQVAGS